MSILSAAQLEQFITARGADCINPDSLFPESFFEIDLDGNGIYRVEFKRSNQEIEVSPMCSCANTAVDQESQAKALSTLFKSQLPTWFASTKSTGGKTGKLKLYLLPNERHSDNANADNLIKEYGFVAVDCPCLKKYRLSLPVVTAFKRFMVGELEENTVVKVAGNHGFDPVTPYLNIARQKKAHNKEKREKDELERVAQIKAALKRKAQQLQRQSTSLEFDSNLPVKLKSALERLVIDEVDETFVMEMALRMNISEIAIVAALETVEKKKAHNEKCAQEKQILLDKQIAQRKADEELKELEKQKMAKWLLEKRAKEAEEIKNNQEYVEKALALLETTTKGRGHALLVEAAGRLQKNQITIEAFEFMRQKYSESQSFRIFPMENNIEAETEVEAETETGNETETETGIETETEAFTGKETASASDEKNWEALAPQLNINDLELSEEARGDKILTMLMDMDINQHVDESANISFEEQGYKQRAAEFNALTNEHEEQQIESLELFSKEEWASFSEKVTPLMKGEEAL
ncbi:hypothetical protein D5R81_07510 [Parashewanella spongiae]|uniref:Uncharacterized protein n=1 Tax=Parashewanella spongiae TaxID=342950 RepID=A0A3A6UJV6_9GAMM|nr:hypothetical protein [Parashewanella spongiae]MCL1078998.1 hypothetical protein [Parashewanella spongiae]RJY17822.1 hypothetical protein D5R81_07510 [Parashewanella spongiae]